MCAVEMIHCSKARGKKEREREPCNFTAGPPLLPEARKLPRPSAERRAGKELLPHPRVPLRNVPVVARTPPAELVLFRTIHATQRK